MLLTTFTFKNMSSLYNKLQKMRRSHGALQDTGDFPDPITRSMGGKTYANQWYYPGHFYVILQPPDKLFNGDGNIAIAAGQDIENITKDDTTNSLAFERWVAGTVSTFTPHTRTPGYEEDTGLGGIKSGFYTGSNEITNEFSLTFKEVSGLPLLQAFELWTHYANPQTGTTSVQGDEVVPSTYKGDCFVILAKPSFSGENREINERDIEQIYYYDGVMPKTVPIDVFNQDLTAHANPVLNVSFNFDGYPSDKSDIHILERCIEEFNNRFNLDLYYNRHYADKTSAAFLDNSAKRSVSGSRGEYRNKGRGIF